MGEVFRVAGRIAEARACYERSLQLNPALGPAHYNLGLLLQKAGEWTLAGSHFEQSARLQPNHAETHNTLGNLLRAQANLPEALAAYQKALVCRPNYPEALNNLGVALIQLKRFEEGAMCLRRSLALEKDSADVYFHLSKACQEQGELVEAIACLQQALRLRPEFVLAHNNLGNIFQKKGELDDAIVEYRRAIQFAPQFAGAHYNLGTALVDQDRLEEAICAFREALRLNPEFTEAYCGLGSTMRRQGQVDDAIACFEHALRLDPDSSMARVNMGWAYRDHGLLDKAETCYHDALQRQGEHDHQVRHEAVSIQSDRAHALCGLGMLDLMRGELAKAADYFQRVLQFAPSQTDARMGLEMAQLGQGGWLAGWPDHADYLQRRSSSQRQFHQPRWDGSPLEGRTILVHAFHGFGDVIHFIRYSPLIHKRGGRVLHEVHEKLIPLLDQSGFGNLISFGSALPEFDVQVSLLSLPGIFQTTLDTVPADIPYLVVDARRTESWAARLADWSGFKIGIHWQGNTAYSLDRCRSLPLERFAPLAKIPGVHLISLQKGTGSEQIAQVADSFIVHGLDGFDDCGGAFLDTLAVMKNLNLVITCDSAMGHLAGALGVPVWVALSTRSDWRWLRDRQDTPWYPTMRLFRQSRLGQWGEVFDRMAGELRRIAGRSPGAIQ
ncbi:MAG TPA: tetratricopeptide repeat protein [Pirellulales bacterium]|nr:tetratricopeptide repeat protein [Pirellulales bacterium]